MRPESHIYIHVPFCARKCPYCDFYSVPYNQPAAECYIKALQVELQERLCQGASPRTLYMGGGTPTVLAPPGLARLFDVVLGYINPARLEEFTVEVNPGTLSDEKISVLKKCGVSRISLGVQSFNDRKLEILGRIHGGTEAREAFENLAAAGFGNIGIDLIYGVPGDTLSAWLEDLSKAVAIRPEHISLYCLSVEPGTVFEERHKSGELVLPEEQAQRELYYSAVDFLAERGFEHYEISNFALPGFHSRHNLATWRYEPYVGFGPSAASFDGKIRRRNRAELEMYFEKPEIYADTEELSVLQQAAEIMMLALRTREGISGDEFHARCGLDLDKTNGKTIKELENRGLLERIQDRIRLTRDALFVSDTVFEEFFDYRE